MSIETNKRTLGKGGRFMDSRIVNFIFEHMLHLLDNPVRKWFNDPVKTLKAAGVRPGLDVLEVGCGTGFFTITAAGIIGDEGCIHAFDIHPLAVEETAKKIHDAGLGNVKLTMNNALDTGLHGESYDLILLFGVIPAPVLPLDELLQEMHRLLKPGGSMAVWTALPLWSPRSIIVGGLFTYVAMRDGVHIFRRMS